MQKKKINSPPTFSTTKALPPTLLLIPLPGSAADVLLIGNAGGCIDSEDGKMEVDPSPGGISAEIIRSVGS